MVPSRTSFRTWFDILKVVCQWRDQGHDLISLCKIKVGDMKYTNFLHVIWIGDSTLSTSFHKIYSLDKTTKEVVAEHFMSTSFSVFLRCPPCGSVEEEQ